MGSRVQGPLGSLSGLENPSPVSGRRNFVFFASSSGLLAANKVVWLVLKEISASLDTDFRLFHIMSATKLVSPHALPKACLALAYSASSVLTNMPPLVRIRCFARAARSNIIDSQLECL